MKYWDILGPKPYESTEGPAEFDMTCHAVCFEDLVSGEEYHLEDMLSGMVQDIYHLKERIKSLEWEIETMKP